MRWLIPVGVVLILTGGAGAVTAYVQSAQDASASVTQDAGDGVPAARANRTTTGALILAPLAGLALAVGVGCIGIGMGRWTHPVPSYRRTANPWNEQPGDKGEPPTGLV